ncbi:hypothetical protein INT45_008636 [Circinella minor]|uniref:Uncharacterized protein n=1 Tax=Circinella minor TaxID=1195481 RepID=A0A8H7S2Q6_9FUNG|nr:hypothetical protein INT45_008636 [Circinella minor]
MTTENISNQKEKSLPKNYGNISEDFISLKDDFREFKEVIEKKFESIESELLAATKQREQIITLLQDLSDKVATLSTPPSPSSDILSTLPESFLEPKSKSKKAALQALTDIDGSIEQGKQSLVTFQCIVENVIKDKEAQVSDEIKKTSWSALSILDRDLKESIINEVTQQVKQALPRFPQDLNGKDWITHSLLRLRWNNVGVVQRRREGNKNKRRRINSDSVSDE